MGGVPRTGLPLLLLPDPYVVIGLRLRYFSFSRGPAIS